MQKIQTTKVNSLQIEFTQFGHGDDLLYLHGGSVSFRTASKFLNSLSKSFSIWAISMPGAGKSSKIPNGWTIENYPDIIYAFCQKMKISPILCGHSFGGAVAALSAIKFPKTFSRLILISPAIVKQKNAKASILKVALSHALKLLSPSSPEKDDLKINLKHKFFDMLKIGKMFNNTDLSDSLKNIKARTLIIGGTSDVILSPQNWKFIHSQIKTSRLFEIRGNHGLVSKNPDQLVDIIVKNRDFIQK